jgi:hypothetical protein
LFCVVDGNNKKDQIVLAAGAGELFQVCDKLPRTTFPFLVRVQFKTQKTPTVLFGYFR